MAKLFQILLDGTEVIDPINWKDFVPYRKRNSTYMTLFTTIGNKPLRFVKDGKDYLDLKYAECGLLANVSLEIRKYDITSKSYISKMVGKVDFRRYRKLKNETVVGFAPTDFVSKFLNRDEMTLSLQDRTDLDGNNIPAFANETLSLTLDAQILDKTSILEQEDDTSLNQVLGPNDYIYVSQNLEQTQTELESEEISNIYELLTVLPENNLKIDDHGELKVNFDFKVGVYSSSTIATFQYVIIQYRNGVEIDSHNTTPANVYDALGLDTLYEHNVDFTFSDVKPGDQFKYYGLFSNVGEGFARTYRIRQKGPILTTDAHFKLTLKQETSHPETTCEGMLAWEFFLRMCQKITGREDCLRSEFLGRTDGEVKTYPSDGAGSMYFMTRGSLVRNFPLSNYPITTSMQDGFNSFKEFELVGLGITHENDLPYIKIEKLSEFFKSETVIMTLQADDDKGVVIDPALDYIFGQVKCGYKNYEKEENGTLGTAHSTRSYTTSLDEHVSKDYNVENKTIASGHLIERLRRDSFENGNTKDGKHDKKLVAIKVKRNASGFERTKDTEFTTVNNIEHPASQYNLDLVPARIIQNHAPLLLAGFSKRLISDPGDISFLSIQSGEANTNLETQKATESLIPEGENLTTDHLNGQNSEPLFSADIGTVQTKLSRSEEELLELTPEGVIEINDDGETYYGFAEEVRITDLQNSKTEIKFLVRHE